jgi:hypothetical protein
MHNEKSSNSYINLVLHSFATLDINKLHVLLKDEYSYQDTTKEIFLGGVNEIFKAHFNSGDTSLLIFDGKCKGGGCENCNKKGYRFIGNISKDYIDLIFIEEVDDIKDIFHCSSFETKEGTGELNNTTSIYIKDDDKITFEKTPEYWAKLTPALKAYDEIITIPPREVSIEDVQFWLTKYSFHYERIGKSDLFSARRKWDIFTELYEKLSEITNFVTTNSFAVLMNALEVYKTISDEACLISWILENDVMYNNIPYDIRSAHSLNPNISDTTSLIIKDKEIIAIFDFVHIFSENHNTLMNKYCIYTSGEYTDILNEDKYEGSFDQIGSLTFHLNQRKQAEELGISIPLNLLYDPNSIEQ